MTESIGGALIVGDGFGPTAVLAKKTMPGNDPDMYVFGFNTGGGNLVRVVSGGRHPKLLAMVHKAGEMQRIPAHIARDRRYLHGPHPVQSTRADSARGYLQEHTSVFTATQGHADWYISRFFHFTASMGVFFVYRLTRFYRSLSWMSAFLELLQQPVQSPSAEEKSEDFTPEELVKEEESIRTRLSQYAEFQLNAAPGMPPLAGQFAGKDDQSNSNEFPDDAYVVVELQGVGDDAVADEADATGVPLAPSWVPESGPATSSEAYTALLQSIWACIFGRSFLGINIPEKARRTRVVSCS